MCEIVDPLIDSLDPAEVRAKAEEIMFEAGCPAAVADW